MQRPARVQDHRPERSQRAAARSTQARCTRCPAGPLRRAPGIAGPAGGLITRPVWLLEPPQPLPERRCQPLLDGAPLQLLSGPERIEAGWWDEGLAGRDYFIAQAADASLVWIYRLRLPDLCAAGPGLVPARALRVKADTLRASRPRSAPRTRSAS